LFPLLLVFVNRQRQRIVLAVTGIFLAALVIRPLFPVSHEIPEVLRVYIQRYSTHRVFDALFAGVLISLLQKEGFTEPMRRIPKFLNRILGSLLVLGICFIPSLFSDEFMNNTGMVIEVGLSLGLVLFASLESGAILEIPVLQKILEWIGSRSFGLYLVHGFALRLAQLAINLAPADFQPNVSYRSAVFVFLTTFFASTLLLTELSYRLVEQPMIRIGARLSRRWKPEGKPKKLDRRGLAAVS
jgi:peptidoglycan/LPS O-acetylase OafA/YrhL